MKTRKDLLAMRTTTDAFLLTNGYLHFCTRIRSLHQSSMPWLSSLSAQQNERLEKVQNEAMSIILGCTRNTPCVTMRFLLDFPITKHRIKIWRACAYLRSIHYIKSLLKKRG